MNRGNQNEREQLFMRAAERGFLEPVINRDGTRAMPAGNTICFNNKHLTAIRRIATHLEIPIDDKNNLLHWANMQTHSYFWPQK